LLLLLRHGLRWLIGGTGERSKNDAAIINGVIKGAGSKGELF
jgi:hypothetical protein